VARDRSDLAQLFAMLTEDVAWKEFEAAGRRRIEIFTRDLRDPSAARKAKYPDDYVRGQIDALEWMLDLPKGIIAAAERQAEINALAQAEQRRADLVASYGPTFPFADRLGDEV
jgi:hypothetical protein